MSKLLILFFLILSFAGCATAPYVAPKPPIAPGMPGVYHKVEKGETLWRISKLYSIDLDEVASVNHISDTTDIEIGQMVFIPNRKKPQSIPVNISSEEFIWPLKGRVINYFGSTFNNMINRGINISPQGSLDVVASRGGRVVFFVDNFGYFGKTLIIDHGDGFSSVYARNAQVFVRLGDSVQKGSVIARVGSTGIGNDTFLHFEIRKGHIPQNPNFYLSR